MSLDISSYLAAAKAGAASVYHDVLATGAGITAWETTHPLVQPFITEGVTFAEGLITRATGIPIGEISVAGEDILSALKALVATDSTVPSLPGTTTTTTTATTTLGALEQAAVSAAVNTLVANVADTPPATP